MSTLHLNLNGAQAAVDLLLVLGIKFWHEAQFREAQVQAAVDFLLILIASELKIFG